MSEDKRKTVKSADSPPAFTAKPQYPEEGSGLGKYSDLRLIGCGGQAAVYKAWDPELKRYAALKVLSRNLRSAEDLKKRFLQEIHIQAKLKLPGIVPVFECGEDRGWIFFAMEYVEGESIDTYFAEESMNMSEKLMLIAKTAEIVASLHRNRLRHRDIKPGNVMIDSQGGVKLLDLGLVKAAGGEMDYFRTQPGDISGTPAYMSPEQSDKLTPQGKKRFEPRATEEDDEENCTDTVSAASDVYSLGVMAYELLTGNLPYAVEHLDPKELAEVIKNETPGPLRQTNRDIPQEAEKYIMKALDKNPEKRPSAGELAAALKRAVEKDRIQSAKLIPAAIMSIVAVIIIVYLLNPGAIFVKSEIIEKPSQENKQPSTHPAGKPDEPPVAKPPNNKASDPSGNGNAENFEKKHNPKIHTSSVPEKMKGIWQETVSELKNNAYLENKGAIIYRLPPKSVMSIKNKGMTLIRVNSMLHPEGCFYRSSGKTVKIELKDINGPSHYEFEWTPRAEHADVLY